MNPLCNVSKKASPPFSAKMAPSDSFVIFSNSVTVDAPTRREKFEIINEMSRKPPGEHYWRDVELRFREDFGRDMTPEERRWFRFSYFVEEDLQPSDSAKKESEGTNRERTSSGKGFRNKP